MRYNTRGDLLAGIGVLSVNRQPIGRGFNPRWLDDDTFLANAPGPDDVFRLYSYHRDTDWQQELADTRGATRIAAGGGNYAVLLATQPHQTVYGRWNRQPLPPWATLCYPMEGHADGRLLFASPDYQQLGILHPDGRQQWFITGEHVNLDSIRLIEDGFIYLDESRSKTLMVQQGEDRPLPAAVVDTPFDPHLITWNGSRWALFHNDATYLQQIGTTRGYTFPASYGPDLFVEPDGTAHVALTPSAGELPDTITLVAPFRLGDGAIDLSVARAPLPPFPAPVWEGPFDASSAPDRYGSVVTPGNCEVIVDGTSFADLKVSRPVIAGLLESRTVPDAYLIAIAWSNEAGGLHFDEHLAEAKARNRPLLVYSDTDAYPEEAIAVCRRWSGCIPMVRGYPAGKRANEPLKATPDQDVARIRGSVQHLRDRGFARIALARSLYTQTGNYPVDHILAMQDALTAIVRDFHLFADCWFAWLRDPEHAIAGIPAFQAVASQLAAAATRPLIADEAVSVPVPVPLPVPPAPAPSPRPVPVSSPLPFLPRARVLGVVA
jgi:hypothetical protein